MYKDYLSLVKPGIIMGNLIAATGGFFFATGGKLFLLDYIYVALGTSLVVASGCVFNNLIDIDIDSKMSRTMSRPLVRQVISPYKARCFAIILGLSGFAILWFLASPLAFVFAVLGFVVYVGLYSLYFKRRSLHGTLIGSVSGACPPIIGYTSVTNEFDSAAFFVFLAFSAWQMPHSYAIAINRRQDYQAALIPVLPVVKGLASARKHMIFFCMIFWISILCLTLFDYLGLTTAVVMSAGSIYWLYQMLSSYGDEEKRQRAWGKSLFLTSIVLVTVFSILMSVDTV